jgi:hypothetical protein
MLNVGVISSVVSVLLDGGGRKVCVLNLHGECTLVTWVNEPGNIQGAHGQIGHRELNWYELCT